MRKKRASDHLHRRIPTDIMGMGARPSSFPCSIDGKTRRLQCKPCSLAAPGTCRVLVPGVPDRFLTMFTPRHSPGCCELSRALNEARPSIYEPCPFGTISRRSNSAAWLNPSLSLHYSAGILSYRRWNTQPADETHCSAGRSETPTGTQLLEPSPRHSRRGPQVPRH